MFQRFKEYQEYIKDNPEGYWFKAKLYGWGWVPARLPGFLVMAVFILAVALNGFRIDAVLKDPQDMLTVFLPETLAMIIALMLVCFATGETPRWQWGRKDKK